MSTVPHHSSPSHVARAAAAELIVRNALAMDRTDQAPQRGPASHDRSLPTDDELREISASLRGLRYGSVSVVVQDGVVVQIDRIEKRRLRSRNENDNPSR